MLDRKCAVRLLQLSYYDGVIMQFTSLSYQLSYYGSSVTLWITRWKGFRC